VRLTYHVNHRASSSWSSHSLSSSSSTTTTTTMTATMTAARLRAAARRDLWRHFRLDNGAVGQRLAIEAQDLMLMANVTTTTRWGSGQRDGNKENEEGEGEYLLCHLSAHDFQLLLNASPLNGAEASSFAATASSGSRTATITSTATASTTATATTVINLETVRNVRAVDHPSKGSQACVGLEGTSVDSHAGAGAGSSRAGDDGGRSRAGDSDSNHASSAPLTTWVLCAFDVAAMAELRASLVALRDLLDAPDFGGEEMMSN
jgi:hypothetical protein